MQEIQRECLIEREINVYGLGGELSEADLQNNGTPDEAYGSDVVQRLAA
jgi:hypothetical protein